MQHQQRDNEIWAVLTFINSSRPERERAKSAMWLLKQHRQLSYQELAFHLEDSAWWRRAAWSAV